MSSGGSNLRPYAEAFRFGAPLHCRECEMDWSVQVDVVSCELPVVLHYTNACLRSHLSRESSRVVRLHLWRR